MSTPEGLKRGDLVKVTDRRMQGYEWTIGKVGSIVCASHVASFDRLHHPEQTAPAYREGWWVVSVCSDTAKGGYALACLPEEHLAPHACTERCPEQHKCEGA